MEAVKELTAAAILAACKPPHETVEVLGGKVTLQGAAANRDAFEALLHYHQVNDAPDLEKLRRFMLAACIVDKDGNRLFTRDDEIEQLGKMPPVDFDKLAVVATRLLAVNYSVADEKKD